jgi:hypothetical protein
MRKNPPSGMGEGEGFGALRPFIRDTLSRRLSAGGRNTGSGFACLKATACNAGIDADGPRREDTRCRSILMPDGGRRLPAGSREAVIMVVLGLR